jgi:tetratricopeptide (TPR) repeat protein
VTAYENALVVRTREQLPQDWAMTQNNLGTVLSDLGTRTGGEEGAKLLQASVTAYENALVVYTREQLPQDWAMTQNNLGNVYRNLGTRTGGEEGAKLLQASVTVLKASLEVRSFEYLPVDWAQSQNNLAKSYELLEDWPNVAACYANVLKVYPDYEQAYQTAGYLYHEVLHQYPADYASAFTLNQNWLTRQPEDLSAQSDFAEKHFTTGRFAECENRIAALLTNAEIEPRVKVALRAIQIANFAGLGQPQKILANLETLQQAIASPPDTFKIGWTFNGTKHFISVEPQLARYREWLLQLFAALEIEEGREAILAALREVRKNFRIH